MTTEATTSAISEPDTAKEKMATLISKTVSVPLSALLIAVFAVGLMTGLFVGGADHERGVEKTIDSPRIERAFDIDECGITTDLAQTNAARDTWTSAIKAIDKVSLEQRGPLILNADSAYQAYLEKASHLALMVSTCAKVKAGR